MSEVKRATRVSERLRMELSAVLRSLRDPRLAGAFVSRVEMTDDLQTARVFVRHELGADDRRARDILRGLTAATGRLRRDTTRALALRYAPALHFEYDRAPEAVDRIEELLREVKDDERR